MLLPSTTDIRSRQFSVLFTICIVIFGAVTFSGCMPDTLVAVINTNTKNALAGQLVVLDGSSSYHSKSSTPVSSYKWKQTSGPKVRLLDADQAKASFVVPAVSEKSTLKFSLEVADNAGLADTAITSIVADKAVPTSASIEVLGYAPVIHEPFAVSVVGSSMHTISREPGKVPTGFWTTHNIDDPTNPVEIAIHSIRKSQALSAVFDEARRRAYINVGVEGFVTYDFTNLSSPIQYKGFNYEDVRQIALGKDDIIFVTAIYHPIHIIDISSPDNPVEAAQIDCRARNSLSACHFDYWNDLLFVSPRITNTGDDATDIYDVSNPYSPVKIQTLIGLQYYGALTETIIYFVDKNRSIKAFDFSTPDMPVEVGTLNRTYQGSFGVIGSQIDFRDNYSTSISSNEDGRTINLHYSESITELKTLASIPVPRGVTGKVLLRGNRIFVPVSSGVYILNFTPNYQ
jgi:hypothetical protein